MQSCISVMVSAWAARNIYCIAFEALSLRLDKEATELRRKAVREERKRRGKKWADFNKEWEAKRPPSEILTYYGVYPDPGTKAHGTDAAPVAASA